MKFIIALLVQEVKNYVVDFLTILYKSLILKKKTEQFIVFSMDFPAFSRRMDATLSRLPRARIRHCKMRNRGATAAPPHVPCTHAIRWLYDHRVSPIRPRKKT
ncbi:MAG: hypothetical protein V4578_12760 [Pseudomonadota bacterium]